MPASGKGQSPAGSVDKGRTQSERPVDQSRSGGKPTRTSSEPMRQSLDAWGEPLCCEICGQSHHINACPDFEERHRRVW
eukprot:8202153-Alexandrium_andersonii.AAC.1